MADNEKVDPVQNKPLTPLERAQQYEQLMRQQEALSKQSAPVAAPKQAAPTSTAAPVGSTGFVQAAKPVAKAEIDGLRPLGQTMGDVGARQVNETVLWSGSKAAEIEIKGNPWKIIPFSTAQERAAAVAPRPGMQLQSLSRDAASVEGFQFVKAAFKDPKSAEPPVSRVLVLDGAGNAMGAECKSADEMSSMLSRMPKLVQLLAGRAFGGEAQQAKLTKVDLPTRGSGYQLTLSQPDRPPATIKVDKFGLPHGSLSAIDLERILKQVDSFTVG